MMWVFDLAGVMYGSLRVMETVRLVLAQLSTCNMAVPLIRHEQAEDN